MNQSDLKNKVWWQNAFVRIYLSGLLVLAIGIVVWKVVFRFSPWYDVVQNPLIASLLTAISLVLFPLLLGAMVVYGLNPILGKWQKWSDLMSLQDRLLGELSTESKPQVVLVDWPSASVKSIGVVTATYPATDTHPEMAGVYIPAAPRGNFGYMRFVKVSDLHFTAWTLSEFQVFNWTLGSVQPDALLRETDDV